MGDQPTLPGYPEQPPHRVIVTFTPTLDEKIAVHCVSQDLWGEDPVGLVGRFVSTVADAIDTIKEPLEACVEVARKWDRLYGRQEPAEPRNAC